MTNQFKIIKSNNFNFNEITDTVYNDLLKNDSNIKSIKIHVNFYVEDKQIDKYFFVKIKTDVGRYAFRNFLYNRYTKFISKYITIEKVSDFIIEINYSNF